MWGIAPQAVDAGGVIAVLMGEKDRVDPVQGLADAGEELLELAGRKAGVDQHPAPPPSPEGRCFPNCRLPRMQKRIAMNTVCKSQLA